jgi:hypothetical protein
MEVMKRKLQEHKVMVNASEIIAYPILLTEEGDDPKLLLLHFTNL